LSADFRRWRSQSRQILRIECAQGGLDRRPDTDDAFFYARSKNGNPKFTAKE
jgi:hypothetical protein